jgi:hypothetical protein
VIPDEYRLAILGCFIPPIPAQDESTVLAEVEGLVSDLREAASMIGPDGRLAFKPIPRIGESDEEYATRAQAVLSCPIEGRPPDRLLFVLVVWVRDLLIKQGCAHGVPKDEEKPCGLTRLVAIVNRLSGKLCASKTKAALRRFASADRAGSPLNQLEFRVGHALQLVRFKDGKPQAPEPLVGEKRKKAEAMLRDAEARGKPPKRRNTKRGA